MRRPPVLRFVGLFAIGLSGCRDVARFSSGSGSYEGPVVPGDFVRAGFAAETRVCLTFDVDHRQDAPGRLTSSDGRFVRTPLRPIPQIWHDPLSTMSFGEGRIQNLLYVAKPSREAEDVLVIVSLMES